MRKARDKRQRIKGKIQNASPFCIFHFAFLILILSGDLSCKKWLNLKPQDGIVSTQFWQKKEDVQAEVIGVYSSLLGPPPAGDGAGDRSLTEYLFMWGELRADMIQRGP